jgi:hypothetical protein
VTEGGRRGTGNEGPQLPTPSADFDELPTPSADFDEVPASSADFDESELPTPSVDFDELPAPSADFDESAQPATANGRLSGREYALLLERGSIVPVACLCALFFMIISHNKKPDDTKYTSRHERY